MFKNASLLYAWYYLKSSIVDHNSIVLQSYRELLWIRVINYFKLHQNEHNEMIYIHGARVLLTDVLTIIIISILTEKA